MGTKNNPGKFDCHAKAAPDEPLFTLLGRDPHAAVLVRVWALLRHRAGEDDEKVAEALACADAMDAYAKEHAKPVGHQDSLRTVSGKPSLDRLIHRILSTASRGMEDHPDDYAHSCDCDLCRSYA